MGTEESRSYTDDIFDLFVDVQQDVLFSFIYGIVDITLNDMGMSMSTTYIVSAIVGSFAVAYICDYFVSDKKIFGGTTPRTVSNKEWWEETDRKFQAWPRIGGSPVVMNPITRQNFIVRFQDS
ncbi:hypothetical protein OIU79_028660 [Salix purpurea]|uniref:Uncharacterized protein n=1 Tax=Salix purpurea TaxID=77065 RepID=A0A9Q1A385_SALPP|nr:hypothetical protein OIU79_028660 [Salix purpurea]